MIYAVGDIHGQQHMLDRALGHLDHILSANDVVIFLGDYIDRGPHSKEVLQMLMHFKKLHPATIFLRGNHEDLLLRALAGDKKREEKWLLSGGMTTLASFGFSNNHSWQRKFPRWAIDFIETTQVAIKTEYYYFVHAGVAPYGVDTEVEQDLDPRLWIRDPFIYYGNIPGKIVVFGHTPQTNFRPLIQTNKVGLDTGAYMPNGRLSVAGFDANRPLQRTPQFNLFQIYQDGSMSETEYIHDTVTQQTNARPEEFVIPSFSFHS